MLNHFSTQFLGINSITPAQFSSGDIPISANTGTTTYGYRITQIDFRKRAVGFSRRLGEFVHIKSSRFADDDAALVQGYLPVKPGTIVNGAIDYPLWAAIYTEFVVGNDIVFPANVEGMFLRNLGGNAANEGVFQADAQHITPAAPTGTQVNSGGGNTIRSRTVGVETRPDNRAYQIYAIVDTYVEVVPTVANDNYSVVGDVKVLNYSNGFVKQWGRLSGVDTATFPVSYKTPDDVDCQITVENTTERHVQINTVTASQIDFVRVGATGSTFRWSCFGEKL